MNTHSTKINNQQTIPGWFSFKGRYTRAQFWNRYILAALIYGVLATVALKPYMKSLTESTFNTGDTDKLLLIATLSLLAEIIVMTTLYLPLMVKRFHDFGYSATTPLVIWGTNEIINFCTETGLLFLSTNLYNVTQNTPEMATLAVESLKESTTYYNYAQGFRIILMLVLLGIMCRDSQRGTNKYGPSTKYPDETEQPNVSESQPQLPPLPPTEEKQSSNTAKILTMLFMFIGLPALMIAGFILLKAETDTIRYTMFAYVGSVAAYVQSLRKKNK